MFKILSLLFFILQVGLWIDAGSRFETAENNGVAHFLEHMIFKVILAVLSAVELRKFLVLTSTDFQGICNISDSSCFRMDFPIVSSC